MKLEQNSPPESSRLRGVAKSLLRYRLLIVFALIAACIVIGALPRNAAATRTYQYLASAFGVPVVAPKAAMVSPAAVLANYGFGGGSLAPSSQDASVSASNITFGSASQFSTPGFPYLFLTVPAGATNATTAVSSNSYFQFTLTPNSTISLTNLTFGVGGNNAPSGGVQKEGYAVRSSADNYGSNLASGIAPVQFANLQTITVDLSAAAFQNLNSAVTFRIYGFINTNSAAEREPAIVFSNITFNGTVAAPPVPEINLKGNGVTIANGSFIPSTADDTDFGSTLFGSGPVEKTFTIENLGSGPLNLTGPQQDPAQPLVDVPSTDFTVTAQPTTPIAGGSSTTFKIRFNPSSAGTKDASVIIANDDADENFYFFLIRANTCVNNPIVTTMADSGAGSLREAIDTACAGSTITFDPTVFASAQTITLNDKLEITKNLTITGPGADKVTVNQTASFRQVFNIQSGKTVNISGLKITGAQQGGIYNSGGTVTVNNCELSGNSNNAAVYNSTDFQNNITGVVTLTGCVIKNNPGGGLYNQNSITATNCDIGGNSGSNPAVYNYQGTMTLTDCNIHDNLKGGVINSGTQITITNCQIKDNTKTGEFGAGIYISGGALTLSDSVISGNSGGNGAGLMNNGTVIASNSRITGNTSTGEGGGVYHFSNTATFTNCTIADNNAIKGAGIYSFGDLNVTGSTISGNTSSGNFNGGGISTHGGSLTLTNSTISGNRVTDTTNSNSGGLWLGIDSTITSCTITGNSASASSSAGGVYKLSVTTTFKNTIIAGNTGTNGANPDLYTFSSFTSGGYNLIGDGTGGSGFTGTADQVGTSGSPINPMLGPLADNGGRTRTHTLLSGSPAIDKGNAFSLTTDQRGVLRTFDASGVTNASDATDIGALEVSPAEINVKGNSNTIANGSTTPSYANFTNLNHTSVVGGTDTKTFVIENLGGSPLNLTGTPKVTVGGTNPADFIVTTQPTSPILAGNSVSFVITFDPTAPGSRDATVSIANDDADETPYTFAITGFGTAPDINIKGNSANILSGSTTPSLANHTDFGAVNVASGMLTRTFTVENSGEIELNLTGTPKVQLGGANAADFTVTTQPTSPVPSSTPAPATAPMDLQRAVAPASKAVSSTNFVVTFDPSAAGLRTATLSIANDDPDENPYTFTIQGGGCLNNLTVTTTADGGAGSLREAIANACPGATITFASPLFDAAQTITLTSGELIIDKNLTLTGPGADKLTISGNNQSRVFTVNLPDNSTTVAISGVTVTGGNGMSSLAGNNGDGGGIMLELGNLTLLNAIVSGNTATSTVNSNGGGITNRGDGMSTLTVTNCIINGNDTNRSGGGIFNLGGPLIVSNSTISNNRAGLQKNSAGFGGGIENYYPMTLTNSTISGNSVANTAGSHGGGIYTPTGTSLVPVQIISCTITGNTASGPNSAGGLRLDYDDGGSLIVSNTIIAGNTGNNSATADVNDATSGVSFTSNGYNLIGDGTGATGFTGTADQVGTSGSPINAMLSPLQNNGGTTPTHTPLPGSPAIDKGKAFGLTTDQAGQVRPKDIASIPAATGGDNSDIGAFEVYNTPPTVTPLPLARVAGSSPTSGPIANVTDLETPLGDLTVTINDSTGASLNGVSVSNLVNANGTITAQVVVNCTATTATFTLKVTDGGGLSATSQLTVTVTPNTPPALSYGTQTVTAATTPSFGPTAATDNGSIAGFALQGITPVSGLSLGVNPVNGQVAVTSATIAQAYTVVIRATDNCGATTDVQFTVNVVCPTITFVQTNLPGATVNAAYNQSLTALPAGGNYTFAVTSGLLPQGLTLNPNGTFSGAPTQSGTFNFRVTATGFGGCSAFYDYVLNVACAGVSITTNSLPGGGIGTPYNQTIAVSPAATYSFAVTSGALPPGLTLNAGTGAITGTPTTGGSFNFTVTASQGGCSSSQSYTVTIGCAAITLSPASPLPNGQAGVAYSQTISVSAAGSYTFSLSLGSLPSGLTLNPTTGLLGGTPTVTGNYSFTIQAQAGSGCTASQSYTLAIVCPTVTVSPAGLPNASTGTAYSQTLSAAPAGGNYTFAVTTGSLPTGLNLNSSTGVITGTPTVANSFTFRVTATGFGGCTGFRDYTIVVGNGACPTITLPATLPNGTIGSLYNQGITASPAGTYSYAVTSGAVPPGTALYTSIGLLFGYPTAAGSYTFTVTATQGACTASKTYTVQISAGFASALSVASDFDGDLKSDLSVFRADGNWEVSASRDGKTETTLWGAPYAPYYDLVVSGDYDGDGKTDPAVFRRGTEYAGYWFIKKSSDGELKYYFWGLPTDVPTPGDYDGDGKTDAAVWRASEGIWYIIRSSDNGIRAIHWGSGASDDVAVPGDYDGDGKTDAAVFRKSNGHWYVKRSSDDKTLDVHWGVGTDVPVPGDYDGDAKTDYAVWRASEGIWYWVESGSAALKTMTLGAAGDVPVPTDYDGDGKADAAVWQAATGNWQIVRSSDGKTVSKVYGRSGDTPVPVKRN